MGIPTRYLTKQELLDKARLNAYYEGVKIWPRSAVKKDVFLKLWDSAKKEVINKK